MGTANDRAKIARLGSAQSALIEAAEELRSGDEDALADEVTELIRRLNDIVAPIRASGPGSQRWDKHGQ